MTRYPGIARAKLFIVDYGKGLAVVLAVVGILALGGAGWIYAHPPTTTVTDQTNKQTIQSTLQPSATVTGDSALFRSGQRVENQPVYLITATPNLTLDVQTTVPDDQPVQVDQQVKLVLQAAHSGDVFWQEVRVLERSEVTTSNGTVTTSTEIDVPRLKDQIAPIRGELGSDGSFGVFVRVTTSYETDQYSGTLNRTTPLHLSDRSYKIDSLTLERTESTPETREVVVPVRNKYGYIIPAVLGLCSLVSAGVLAGLYRRRGRWDGVEDLLHQDRYTEWISTGALSSEMGDRYVSVGSLEDLVDIGIDMGKRVIHDRDRETYAVIDGDVVYYYGEEATWAEWAPKSMNADGSAEGDGENR